MLSTGIILSSVREVRRGEAFAKWVHSLAAARPGLQAELIDLKDWPLPPFTAPVAATKAEAGYPDGSLERRWSQLIARLDAFVIVTPEYNHGYPGQLKNALDTLYQPWNHKPVAFVAYGGFSGGARSAMQLQSVACELRMVPVRDMVTLSMIGLQVDEKGFPSAELQQKRAAALLDELTWLGEALKDARSKPRPS